MLSEELKDIAVLIEALEKDDPFYSEVYIIPKVNEVLPRLIKGIECIERWRKELDTFEHSTCSYCQSVMLNMIINKLNGKIG